MKRLHKLPAITGLGGNQLHEEDTAPTQPTSPAKLDANTVQPSHTSTIDGLSTDLGKNQMFDTDRYSSNFNDKLSAASSSTEMLSTPTSEFPSPGLDIMSDIQMNVKSEQCALTPNLDSIIEAANEFIERERKHNFYFLARHSRQYKDVHEVLVMVHADDADVQNLRNKAGRRSTIDFQNHQWYAFSEPLCSNGLRRVVAIEIIPEKPITAANMRVLDVLDPYRDGRVVMLDTWLRESYEWHDTYAMRFRDIQRSEQQLWWESNGKAFSLLDLPLELRESIYLHIIGFVVLPDIIWSKNQLVTLGAGFSYGDRYRPGFTLDPDIEPPNLTIVRVNKQVYKEVMEVAHRDTFKRFRAMGRGGHSEARPRPRSSFYVNITRIRSLTPHVAFLRNMQLEMSAVRYFSFIGIMPTLHDPVGLNARLSGMFPQSRRIEAEILSTFSALQNLDLRFISPKHPEAACPWTVRLDKTLRDTHSCQKLWIDWFLTFAWDYLNPLRQVNISLSGCVKNSTRMHWEYILNEKRIDWTPEIKNLEFEIWKNKSDMTPISCICSIPCSKADNPLAHHAWTQHELKRMDGLQKEMDKIYWDFED